MLIHKLNRRFAPFVEPEKFRKEIPGTGKHELSGFGFDDLYQKRGDAYLRIGDYERGVLDFQRIFVGIPRAGDYINRWRTLGTLGHGENLYLDAKASTPSSRPPRIWVKSIGPKQSVVTAFELDCSSHRLRAASGAVYDANNNIVGNSDNSGIWSDVIPDTIGEKLWNGTCHKP